MISFEEIWKLVLFEIRTRSEICIYLPQQGSTLGSGGAIDEGVKDELEDKGGTLGARHHHAMHVAAQSDQGGGHAGLAAAGARRDRRSGCASKISSYLNSNSISWMELNESELKRWNGVKIEKLVKLPLVQWAV